MQIVPSVGGKEVVGLQLRASTVFHTKAEFIISLLPFFSFAEYEMRVHQSTGDHGKDSVVAGINIKG